jgi:hypothetical protein
MTRERNVADQTACPACGSGRIVCMFGREYDFCMECQHFWERVEPDQHYAVDEELLAFTVPCDNCAFRGKSPERKDSPRWAELQQTLAMGGHFYCHKGVPIDPADVMRTEPGQVNLSFKFPKVTKTVDLAGECHPYECYDTSRMRLCRGFLNAHVRPMMRELAREAAREAAGL